MKDIKANFLMDCDTVYALNGRKIKPMSGKDFKRRNGHMLHVFRVTTLTIIEGS